ncbi:phage replisome organizer N-terminal domain-containing protein [Clostridium cagae]|uniref:phage replisome organizer N-terminal domain-containing protein n=1 Tax=Clostridium cagae TaxID=2080751 RepID=UPI000CF61388|nr:phage replisome organizer N-terminal domain-containing protein [Clostridium cagae]
MSERKIVKLRVDMYSDTKFKIIDTMEDRDLIHYIWTRLLTLAGKVNLEGELYLSKSIPYTIETLALEFNRSAKMVEIALKAFMDLEMVELTKDNVYRVRNFAKHQNIKSKKKDIDKDKLETVDNIEGVVDKSSDIDGIVNKELMENTHDIGNVIDEDKPRDREDNINNKEFVVNNDRKKITSNIYNKRDDVIHADKTALHKSNYINTTEVLKSKVPIDNEVNTKDKINLDRKKDIDVTELSESNDKSTLNKNLLKNDVSKKDKLDLDKEFMFSKDKNKKKRNKPNKKDEACDIISIWDDEEDNIDICEFTDKPPEGKVIRTFFIPEV